MKTTTGHGCTVSGDIPAQIKRLLLAADTAAAMQRRSMVPDEHPLLIRRRIGGLVDKYILACEEDVTGPHDVLAEAVGISATALRSHRILCRDMPADAFELCVQQNMSFSKVVRLARQIRRGSGGGASASMVGMM